MFFKKTNNSNTRTSIFSNISNKLKEAKDEFNAARLEEIRICTEYGLGYGTRYAITTVKECAKDAIESIKKPSSDAESGRPQETSDTARTNTAYNSFSDAESGRPQEASDTARTNTAYNSFYTKVVGVTFEGRQEYVKQCREGQALDLVRDKFNPYDQNAIAVYAGNHQVGFISKEIAAKMATQMDSGKLYTCEVSTVTGGGGRYYGLNIKITEFSQEKSEEGQYNDEDDREDRWTTRDIAEYYGYQYDDDYSAEQFLDDL